MSVRNEVKVIEGWWDHPSGCKMFTVKGDDVGVRINIHGRVDYKELAEVLSAVQAACEQVRPNFQIKKKEAE